MVSDGWQQEQDQDCVGDQQIVTQFTKVPRDDRALDVAGEFAQLATR